MSSHGFGALLLHSHRCDQGVSSAHRSTTASHLSIRNHRCIHPSAHAPVLLGRAHASGGRQGLLTLANPDAAATLPACCRPVRTWIRDRCLVSWLSPLQKTFGYQHSQRTGQSALLGMLRICSPAVHRSRSSRPNRSGFPVGPNECPSPSSNCNDSCPCDCAPKQNCTGDSAHLSRYVDLGLPGRYVLSVYSDHDRLSPC